MKTTDRKRTAVPKILLTLFMVAAASFSPNASRAGDISRDDLKAALNQVADLGDSTHRLVHSIDELSAEFNHRGLNPEDELNQMILNPNIYAPGEDTIGKNSGPLLPPRPKWIEYDMKQITALMENLKKEIDALNASSNAAIKSQGRVKAQLDVLSDSFQVALGQYVGLKKLTAGPYNPANSAQVTVACKAIKDQITGIEECRKTTLKELKHDK